MIQNLAGIMAKLLKFSSKHGNMPPGTAWILTRLIWIGIVFKNEMKTEPVHTLEYMHIGLIDNDRLLTMNTEGRWIEHFIAFRILRVTATAHQILYIYQEDRILQLK